jgi:protein-S-isoprenylcysteine O-methyltransferase Ste14
MVALGRFLFRYRGVVSTLILLIVLAVSTPRHLQGNPALDWWMDILGALVVFMGLATRAITIGYEYVIRGGRAKQVYADNLVQGGVYAHTRNPMYVGNSLIILGWAIIVHAPEFYLVALPLTALLYASIIATEESYLREKFGAEFDSYCARVNRIIPRLSGFRASIEGMRFNWRRVLVKDYSTIFLSIAAVLLLSFWDDYRILGKQGLPRIGVAFAFAVPWLLLYFVVWRLKKTRRLEAEPSRRS